MVAGTAVFTSLSSPDDLHCVGTAPANPSVTGGLAGTPSSMPVLVTTPSGQYLSTPSPSTRLEYFPENFPIAHFVHPSVGVLTDAGGVYKWVDQTSHGATFIRIDSGVREPTVSPAFNGTPYPAISCANSDMEMAFNPPIQSGRVAVFGVIKANAIAQNAAILTLAGDSGATNYVTQIYPGLSNWQVSDTVVGVTSGAHADITSAHVFGWSTDVDAGPREFSVTTYNDTASQSVGTGNALVHSGPYNAAEPNHLCSLPGSYYGGPDVFADALIGGLMVYDLSAGSLSIADTQNILRIWEEEANISFPPPITRDAGQPCITRSGTNCVFADDFNSTHVDVTKWLVDNEIATGLLSNPQWSFCATSANVSEDSGVLSLAVTHNPRARGGCPTTWDAQSASSGPMDAATTFDIGQVAMQPALAVTYGTIEVRAKMGNASGGIGSVIWLLGSAGINGSIFGDYNLGFNNAFIRTCNWPFDPCFEIDVVEIEGEPYPTSGNTSSTVWTMNGYRPATGWTTSTDPNANYYVYTAVWAPGNFSLYVGLLSGGADGALAFAASPASVNMPYSPMSVVLSIWALVNAGGSFNTDAASLPQIMQIDHVYVSQDAAQCLSNGKWVCR